MATTRARGTAAESLAASYLELAGWVIEQRNVRLAGVEIDLLARDGRTCVLVEVKLRVRSDYGGAALAVDHAKRERLRRAAASLGLRNMRIDVVAIDMHAEGATIRHYRSAVTDEG